MNTTHPSYPPDITDQAVVVIIRTTVVTILIFLFVNKKLRRR